MRSLILLSLLMLAAWVSSIPTLMLINLVVQAIELSWLRSLLGVIIFGGWVGLWYILLKLFSKIILSAGYPAPENIGSRA